MRTYIGTKIIKAEPMRLMAAERVLNRKIKDGDSDGYLVTYADGYSSWSPRLVFEKDYRQTDCMGFEGAINLLKKGYKVARKGWNGKNQYIELAFNVSYKNDAGEIINVNHKDMGNKAIAFVGTSGVQLGWLASQTDMLVDDWEIFE